MTIVSDSGCKIFNRCRGTSNKYNRACTCFIRLVCVALLLACGSFAQEHLPEPAALPAAIVAPRDVRYPGTLELVVDATDVQRRILNVQETVPVHPGDLTLLYPEWIPGNHSPTGPISDFAGLIITAGGTRLNWVRDRVNVYAFHVRVPDGASSIRLEFQYLSPLSTREGRISVSNNLEDIQWNSVVLYPAGYFSRDIDFRPTLIIPRGWKFASALEVLSSDSGTRVQFKPTTLNTLVDSPVYAGENHNRVDLSTGPNNQVFLDLFGDTPESVAITPQLVQWHKNLTVQAQKLFASHHYSHYDFLFSLSNTVGTIGLEHHQSSEDGLRADFLTKWDQGIPNRDLLAHEYTHSWNGKFRRPADLWTPNFNVPMQDDLLWVYEGLTQYWGYVLTARAGLRTPEETRDLIARVAANFEISPGRTWRPLVDTTNQPTVSQRRAVPWASWLRPEDYYTEGLLIWMDADTKIRELSGGRKSLDDFAKSFYGVDNGSYITQTYSFADIVHALSAIQPYDWDGFLKKRVYQLAPHTPEEGIRRGGYRLIYSDTPPEWVKRERHDEEDQPENFGTSVGFTVAKDGTLANVWWDSPAFKSGITPDMQITAINGKAFKLEALHDAILQAEKSSAPIRFLMKRGDRFETIDINYHGGLRYPKLDRVQGTPDLLGEILAPVP